MFFALIAELFQFPLVLVQVALYIAGIVIARRRRAVDARQSRAVIIVFSMCLFSWLVNHAHRAWIFYIQTVRPMVYTKTGPKSVSATIHPGTAELMGTVTMAVGYFDQIWWIAIWASVIYAFFYASQRAEPSPANA